MLRLLILRHAKAEKAMPGADDHARKLDATGRADAPRIGAFMAQQKLQPACALVSSAARTRETWELVRAAISGPAARIEHDLYNAGPAEILAVLGNAPQAAEIIVVGHNPGLHDVALMLAGSGDDALRMKLEDGLPTSGLVVIDFDVASWQETQPGRGKLVEFVSPKGFSPRD